MVFRCWRMLHRFETEKLDVFFFVDNVVTCTKRRWVLSKAEFLISLLLLVHYQKEDSFLRILSTDMKTVHVGAEVIEGNLDNLKPLHFEWQKRIRMRL